MKANPLLHTNLHTPFSTRCATLGHLREEIRDIVPRMPVQTCPQSLLVEIMRNQTDGAAKHEQAVQHAVLEVVFGLFCAEGAAVAHEVDEADGDTAVDVEDEVVFLRGCDGLDGDGVVEELGGWEALLDELFDELYAEIGVVAGFDAMADTRDWRLLAIRFFSLCSISTYLACSPSS